jgi:hypothetical protein
VPKLPDWLILIPGGVMFVACWTAILATVVRFVIG